MARPVVLAIVGLLAGALFAGALRDHGAPAPSPPERAPAPEAGPAPPRDPGPPPCLAGVAGAARWLQDLDLSRALTLHREMRKTVDLDNRTVLAAIALAQSTRAPLPADEVTNHSVERIDLCSFEAGAGDGNGTGSLRRVVLFRTQVRHNATLDTDTALRAIMLNASGVPVDPREVVTFRHEERTERVFDQVAATDADGVLLALRALLARPAREDGRAAAAAGSPEGDAP